MATFNPNTDYTKLITAAYNNGENTYDLQAARDAKIKATPGLKGVQSTADLISSLDAALNQPIHEHPYEGGMASQGRREYNNIINQAPGAEGLLLDGTSLTGGTPASNAEFQNGSPHAALLNSLTGYQPPAAAADTSYIAPTGISAPAAPQRDFIAELKAAQLASRMASLSKGLSSGNANLDNQLASYNTQRAGAITELDKGKANQLSTLDTQYAGVEPDYYGRRNQVQAASDLGQMNFAQFQASRGIKGNAGAMPEIYKNNALQGNLGNLNRQQQKEYDNINTNKTGVNTNYQSDLGQLNTQQQAQLDLIANNRTQLQNNYQSDISAANADVEQQAMQSYITQMNADRAYELSKAGVTGSLGGTPTLAAQQNTTQNNQWQQGFDQSAAQSAIQNNQWNTTNAAAAAQQDWSNKFQEGQQATQASQAAAAAAYNASRDKVLDSQWMSQFSLSQQQLIADNLYRKGQLEQDVYDGISSRINANASATNANKVSVAKTPSTDSLYNSTYSKGVNWKNAGLTEAEIITAINATQGLDPQQKAEIANSLFP